MQRSKRVTITMDLAHRLESLLLKCVWEDVSDDISAIRAAMDVSYKKECGDSWPPQAIRDLRKHADDRAQKMRDAVGLPETQP